MGIWIANGWQEAIGASPGTCGISLETSFHFLCGPWSLAPLASENSNHYHLQEPLAIDRLWAFPALNEYAVVLPARVIFGYSGT